MLARYVIGIFCTSVAAYYLPVLLLAAVGNWINTLMDWTVNLSAIAVMMVLNCIGNKINRVLMLNLILAFALDIYGTDLTIRMWYLWGFAHSWQNYVWVNSVLPLNALFWLRYKKSADI